MSTSSASSAAPAAETPAGHRSITKRRSLPGSRAIAGGVLVAVAVIGTFATITGATTAARQPYVVAARDLPAGTRLQASDLRVVRLDIESTVARHAFTDPAKLQGSLTLGPVSAGSLVQPASVTFRAGDGTGPQISLSLPASRALGGAMRSGEKVDVVATAKDIGTGSTKVAATDALVVRSDQGNGSGIGRNGDVIVTLGLRSTDEAVAVANAVDQGQVTLIRTTGTGTSSVGSASSTNAPSDGTARAR